jgi:hypothetical protein
LGIFFLRKLKNEPAKFESNVYYSKRTNERQAKRLLFISLSTLNNVLIG